jgi:hypothetical protein
VLRAIGDEWMSSTAIMARVAPKFRDKHGQPLRPTSWKIALHRQLDRLKRRGAIEDKHVRHRTVHQMTTRYVKRRKG